VTIDLSELPQEKRCFLKAHPELLASLEKAIPNRVSSVNTRKEKESRRKSKLQRNLEEIDRRAEEARQRADRLRRQYDPKLMEINEKYQRRLNKIEAGSGLICPECKDSDHGNRMNGKSWCMKCNKPLISRKDLEKWKKMPEIKISRDAIKKELQRLNPGLYPDNRKDK